MALGLNLDGAEFAAGRLRGRTGTFGLGDSVAVVHFLPWITGCSTQPFSPPERRWSAASLTLRAISTWYRGTVARLCAVKN